MTKFEIILFVVTFYFSVLRYITKLKIFNNYLKDLYELLGVDNKSPRLLRALFTTFSVLTFMYQIYFWGIYFNIIK